MGAVCQGGKPWGNKTMLEEKDANVVNVRELQQVYLPDLWQWAAHLVTDQTLGTLPIVYTT
jgi:hypothetical protein